MSSPKIGSAGAADSLLAEVRGRRQRLAGAVKAALLDLQRHPSTVFPSTRQQQVAHEQQVLEQALAALLAVAPEVEAPRGTVDRELQRVLRELAG